MKITQDIDPEMIRNLLCCAFEGGSNYWYMIEKANPPEGFVMADYKEGGKAQGENYWHWAEIIPLQEGGSLVMSTKERDRINGKNAWKLDLEAIEHGLKLMAEKQPRHYADFVAQNEDADTGDVFLQLCLFGEMVFG